MEHPFCPSCGFNFRADRPVEKGRWRLTPSAAELDGREISVTRSQAGILHALALSAPRPIPAVALGNRVGDAQDPANLVAAQISKMRRVLGGLCPVESVRGRGYRWREAI